MAKEQKSQILRPNCLLPASARVCGIISLPFPLLVNRAGPAYPEVPAALFSGQEMALGGN